MRSARKRVLVSTRLWDQAATDLLEANGFDVVLTGRAADLDDGDIAQDEMLGLLDGCHGWILGTARVSRELLEKRPELLAIARRGVGYDRVDVDAVRRCGRVLAITTGGNEPSVADHAVALMLAVLKRLRLLQRRIRDGEWTPVVAGDLTGKTVGLIGTGRIGRLLIPRLAGFETEILACDPVTDPDLAALGVRFVDLDTLARESDIVSLHLPLTAASRHLVDAAFIDRMKPGAILINTARGGLIDDAALLAALERHRLGGAGLDVFEAEHDPAARQVADALARCANVVATPHAAGSSREALGRSNRIAAENVVAICGGQPIPPGRLVVDGRG